MAKEVQEAVNEAAEGLKEAVKSRLSNPLLGSFALTWVLVNHRVVMVLLSGMSIKEKFEYLDKVMVDSAKEWQLHMFWIPLSAALLFAFLWPIIGMGVEIFNLWVERKSVERQLKSKSIEVLPMTEVVALRNSLETHVGQARSLKGDVYRLRAEAAGYRAVASIFREVEIERDLKNYLLKQPFGVYTSSNSGAVYKAKLVFNSDGSMIGTPEGVDIRLPGQMAFWGVRGTTLHLSDAEGAERRSLDFNPHSGNFEGRFFSDQNYMKGLVSTPQ